MNTQKFRPATLLVIAVALLVVIWAAVIGAILIWQPDVTRRVALVAFAAVATEAVLYFGAAVFGISLFKKLSFFRKR